MALAKNYRIATAMAASGFLIAGLARPAVDYLRFHHVAAGWALPLEALSIAGLFIGAIGFAVAAIAASKAQERAAVSTGRVWLTIGLVTLGLGAVGALIGFGFYAIHNALAGEAKLWFEMGVHAVFLLQAIVAAAMCVRGPPGPASA